MKRTSNISYALFFILFSLFSTAEELKVTTWNIEWLSLTNEKKVRGADDWQQLKQYHNAISPDILAFQEVDDKAAIQAIVDSNYHIIMSQRSDIEYKAFQFSEINQYTGFAIKNTIQFSTPNDLILTPEPYRKLRFASYIILHQAHKKEIHLLSVHLKTGCYTAYKKNSHCETLSQQVDELNDWIKERNDGQEDYVILGDFNHNLAYKNDWVWNKLTDNLNVQPHLSSELTSAECLVRSKKNQRSIYRYPTLVDHIIVSPSLSSNPAWITAFSKEDVIKYQLSDHCPLSNEIPLKTVD